MNTSSVGDDRDKVCDAPCVKVESVEEAVLEFYERIRFRPTFLAAIRRVMYETLKDHEATTHLLRRQLTTQLARLDTQESNLIELAAEGTGAKRKVRQKLMEIERQRRGRMERLEGVDSDLGAGVELVEAAHAVLERLDGLYRGSTDAGRKQLHQALFEKLYVVHGGVVSAEFRFRLMI